MNAYDRLERELRVMSFVPQNMVLEGIDAEDLSKLPREFFKKMTRSQMKDLMRSYVTAFRDKGIGNLTPYREELASAFSSSKMRKYVTIADINLIGFDTFIPLKDLELELLQALIDRWSRDSTLTSVDEKELKLVSLEEIEENSSFNSLDLTEIFFRKISLVNPPANWPTDFFKRAESSGINLAALQLDGGIQMDINSSTIQSFRAIEDQRNRVFTDYEDEEEEVSSPKKSGKTSRIKMNTRSNSNQARASKLNSSNKKLSQAKLSSVLRKSSQLDMQKEIKREVKRTMSNRRRNTVNGGKREVRKAKEPSETGSDSDSDDDEISGSSETDSEDSANDKKKKKKKSSRNRKRNSSRSRKDRKKKGRSRRKKDSDSESSDSDLKELRRRLKKRSSRRKKEREIRSNRRKSRNRTRNGITDLGNSFHTIRIIDD
jgi:hypothetical protein